MGVYGLKGITAGTMQIVHMNQVMDDNERFRNPTDRDEVIIELKALMGDRWRTWYDFLYDRYRRTNVPLYEKLLLMKLERERNNARTAASQ